MNNVTLSISDIIQLAGISVSLLTSLIAIIISVITLRQNSKMIEESSRPVISVYTQTINPGTPMLYLVVKNFGNSTAYMQKFTSDFAFIDCYKFPTSKNYIEDDLSKCVIAPGQARTCLLDYNKIKSSVHFSLVYKSSTKTYREELDVDLKAAADMPTSKYATKDKELISISYSLQDMLLKNL